MQLKKILFFILFFLSWSTWATDCERFLDQKEDDLLASLQSQIDAYVDTLAPFEDPFRLVFTEDEGASLFQRLLRREETPGKWKDSPLVGALDVFQAYYLGQKELDREFVLSLLKETERALKNKRAHQLDLQSNLLALRYAHDYVYRFKTPEVVIDREGQQTKPDEKEKGDKKKQKKQEEDIPPEYQELPKEYQPHTKNLLGNEGASSKKKHVIAEVNFKTLYFGQRFFSEIVRGVPHPFRQTSLPIGLQTPSRSITTGKEMIVRTYGKSPVSLFLPTGHKPLQPTDPRAKISRAETGEYILTLTEPFDEIHIPLLEESSQVLPPHLKEIYTRPVGIGKEEWPEDVQVELFHQVPQDTPPLAVAKAVEEFIATKYLYSLGPRPEKDPIEALKSGAFQCDMAAFIMTAILRDVYGIACRVRAGMRGKRGPRKKGEIKSYLIFPSEAHAWVEVFVDGQWQAFDPTPRKKDQKDSREKEKTEYPDWEQNKEEEDQDPVSESESSSEGESLTEKELMKRIEEATKKRLEDKKEPEAQEKLEEDAFEENKDQLLESLELGSLELAPTQDRNPLIERVFRLLLKMALQPTQASPQTMEKLHQLSALLKEGGNEAALALYEEALSIHEKEHPSVKNWLDEIALTLDSRSVNVTYQELYRLRKAIELYVRTLDRQGRIAIPVDLMALLKEAQERLKALAHPDSHDIFIVNQLVRNLPSVVRLLLKQQYDFEMAGPNAPTRAIAKGLRGGKLTDLRLLSILGPHSDFILNATPRPEFIEIRTWQKDSARPMGRDLLPLQRFSDLSRAMMGQPGKTLEENIREGTAFVITRRKRVDIPAGHGTEEAERITIILYDTSGSMNGDPARFQAGLIGAFTARALSDLSPSGRHRHRVVIVPFDTTPKKPVRVTNTQEALDVIRNYQSQLHNTNGGTNIQKALLQAFALIADAEKKAGEPLAAANMLLMTDGQADINMAELQRARNAIDRDTPIQVMFAAVNQTNPALMQFAMESRRMGCERGFYREFDSATIKDVLAMADDTKFPVDETSFYSENDAKDIPPEVERFLGQAKQSLERFLRDVFNEETYMPAQEHLRAMEKIRWRNIAHEKRPLERWIRRVRNVAIHPIFKKDRRVLERVVDDLLTHMEHLTGIPFDDYSDYEQEQLRHLVRYAAGLEEGM